MSPRDLSFEPRADGRAVPVEHDDIGRPAAPGGAGESVRLRRRAAIVWTWPVRAMTVAAATIVADVAAIAVIEAVPPTLPFVLLFGFGMAAVIFDQLVQLMRVHRRLYRTFAEQRAELELSQRQREEGRARIRELMLRVNGSGRAPIGGGA